MCKNIHGIAYKRQSELHNIYIQLRKESKFGESKNYVLVLGGYGFKYQELCSPSKHVSDLRQLGIDMARNSKLNYFDEHNRSDKHVVVHYK